MTYHGTNHKVPKTFKNNWTETNEETFRDWETCCNAQCVKNADRGPSVKESKVFAVTECIMNGEKSPSFKKNHTTPIFLGRYRAATSENSNTGSWCRSQSYSEVSFFWGIADPNTTRSSLKTQVDIGAVDLVWWSHLFLLNTEDLTTKVW